MTNKRKKYLILVGVTIYVFLILMPLIGAYLQHIEGRGFSFNLRRCLLLANSLKLGVAVVVADLLMGFFCALRIYRSRRLTGWKRFYFLMMLPIPFYVYALSWMYSIKLLSLIWPGMAQYTVAGLGACIYVEGMAFLPIATLFLLIGIESIDSDKLRMALVYGNANNVVKLVVVPSVRPYFAAAGGLILILSMTEFSVPSMFQYNTYALDLFSVYSRTGDVLTAYLQCIPLMLLLGIPGFWLIQSIKRFGLKPGIKSQCRLETTGIVAGCENIAFGISVLQIVVPIVILAVMTGGMKTVFVSATMIGDAMMTSFGTSFFSAVICVMLAVAPAIALCKKADGPLRLILFSVVMPGAIQAMGLLRVINQLGWTRLERSIFMNSIGCALKFTPFVILLFCVAGMRADRRAIEMAELLAVRKKELWGVRLAIMGPACLAGFCVAFLLTFAEESISLILMAPGCETATVKIYNYLHYGASEYVSAFCLLVIGFVFLTEAVMFAVCKRMKRNVLQ